MNNLKANEGDVINIRLVTLPKGQYVKLQPLEEEFAKLEDGKAILESELRSYAALTVGDVLKVNFEDKSFLFNILDAKPSNAIDINDTDILLDLFTITTEKENTDTITNDEIIENPVSSGFLIDNIQNKMDVKYGTCDNCSKEVPIDSLSRHTAFCQRNNIKCESCHRVVPKNQFEQHLHEMHEEIECVCGEKIEKFKLFSHKKEQCSHRLKKCKYCKLSKKVVDMKEHLSFCSSRTELCKNCNRPIMLRDFKKHISTQCAYPPQNIRTQNQEKSFVSSVMDYFGFK